MINFDLIKFAKQILSEIDNIRSVTISESDGEKGTKQTSNESRVNAFYRLIGFPMFVTLKRKDGEKLSEELSNVSRLTPGYVAPSDGSEHPIINGKISIEDAKEVANLKVKNASGADTKLKFELQDREDTLIDMENALGTELMSYRMVAAFYKPMGITMVDKNSATILSTLIEDDIVKNRYRYKKLTPFVTMAGKRRLGYQPLWDIYPKKNTLSKPFVLNPDLQKINSTTTLKRPFIESVIRIRMVNATANSTYFKETKVSLDKLGIKLPSSGTLLEAVIINKMLSSLGQLAKKWHQLNLKRQEIISKNLVFFFPSSKLSKDDPSGKRAFKSFNVKAQAGTKLGMESLVIKQKVAETEALLSLLPTDSSQIIKTKGKNVALINNISSNALTSPFISILNSELDFHKKQLAKVDKKIKDNAINADKLRYELEMMTGEFLGISICDIVCIIIGLFVVDKKYLVALLDDHVHSDMAADPVLKEVMDTALLTSAGEALSKLEEAVKSVYGALQKEIDVYGDKTKRTKKTDKKNKVVKPKISKDIAASHPSIDDLLKKVLEKS